MPLGSAAATATLASLCQTLAPGRGGLAKPMRVLICGVPNVGKSTLINSLTNKRHARTADEAGVTKLEQRITLADERCVPEGDPQSNAGLVRRHLLQGAQCFFSGQVGGTGIFVSNLCVLCVLPHRSATGELTCAAGLHAATYARLRRARSPIRSAAPRVRRDALRVASA